MSANLNLASQRRTSPILKLDVAERQGSIFDTHSFHGLSGVGLEFWICAYPHCGTQFPPQFWTRTSFCFFSGSCSPSTPQPACLERAKGNDQTCLGQAKKLSLHQGVFQFQDWGKQVITHLSQHHKLHLKNVTLREGPKMLLCTEPKLCQHLTPWKCCIFFSRSLQNMTVTPVRRDFFTKGLNSRLDWKTPPKARACLNSNQRKNVPMSVGDEFVLFHSSTKNKTSMAVLAKNHGPQREGPFSNKRSSWPHLAH